MKTEFQLMQEGLRRACEKTPEGAKERKEIADAVFGLTVIVSAIVYLFKLYGEMNGD